MLPLHIDVKDRLVLIVGGGNIAYRRLSLFLEEGAEITVVSPDVVKEIENLHEQNLLNWVKKKVDLSDLEHAFIIIAATDYPSVNEWVAENANKFQLVNVVNNVEKGNFLVPKSVKKGRLSLSVSTNGASPKLAKEICEELSNQFDDSFIENLDHLYEQRLKKKQRK
jgi:precorrin-2 dehydrogenase / sirohydrochlorin ferrochelatase